MNLDQKIKKQLLRELLKKSRADVPESRRAHASHQAYTHLEESLKKHSIVVSYFSFDDEFCMQQINRQLAQGNKLALPRVVGHEMKVYLVTDLDNDLVKNKWGIMEPNPHNCEEICLTNISLVIVPAIGFDINNHRIGYGGGFYDRFLAHFPVETVFLGVGYKEQFSKELIPAEPTDIPLSEVFLY